MYAIQKTFKFSAGHRLGWCSEEHPCNRKGEHHGHNYEVTLRFEADKLDEMGFVIDTHALVFFKTYLDLHCDNRALNISLPALDGQITGERLAQHFASVVHDFISRRQMIERGFALVMVRVCETDTVCAEWWE